MSLQLQIEVERRHFDGGLAAKDDHACPVAAAVVAVFGNVLHRVVEHRAPLLSRNALRLIEQIDYGHLFAGAAELRLGQRPDDQHGNQATQDHRGQPASHANARQAAPPHQRDVQQYRNGQQPP